MDKTFTLFIRFGCILAALICALIILGSGQTAFGQTRIPLQTLVYAPTINITTGAASTTVVQAQAAVRADVVFSFGTVVGSYTGCTVQAMTDYDGNVNHALSLGSAVSITVASNTFQAWSVFPGSATTASSSVAQSIGIEIWFAVSCGGYGTSVPTTVGVIFPGNGAGAGGGGGGGGNSNIHDSSGGNLNSTGGALNVNAAALPLPAGASTAAKQPALGTAGTPSADVITVQGNNSGTPIPVINSSLPLPTGAATSAKQPALGTAGSPSTDVITVQGAGSGTALPVSASALPLPSGAATASNQTGGGAKSQIVDGSGNVVGSTGNALDINLKTNSVAPNSGQNASAADTTMYALDRGGVLPILFDNNASPASGTFTLIAGVSSKVIYDRSISVYVPGSTSQTVTFGSGTGVNCGSTFTAISPAYTITGATASSNPNPGFIFQPFLNGIWFKTNTSENLCMRISASVTTQVVGAGDQF